MFDLRWDKWHQERSGFQSYPNEDFTFFVLRNFGSTEDRSQIRFLDVGCGNGPSTWFLAREGFTVTALDGSRVALDRCRQRLLNDGLGIREFVHSDCVNLPFEDASFECVVDVVCLHSNSIENVVASVNEAWRVLVPGGILYSVMPSAIDDRGAYEGQGEYIYLTQENFQQIFGRFAKAAITVVTRRSVVQEVPVLEHLHVAAVKHA